MKHRIPLLLVVVLLSSITKAQDGIVDTTYGGVKVRLNIVNGYNYFTGITARNDDRIVAAGTTIDNSTFSNSLAIMRYYYDGTLDQTFGTDGKTIVSLASGGTTAGIDIRSDGKIAVTGKQDNGSTDAMYVAFFNDNGTLDTAFGTAGISTLPIGITTEGVAVKIISGNGKILVAGRYNDLEALYRLNTDGSIDSTFGASGICSTNFLGGPESGLYGIEYRGSDGATFVCGYSYNSEGSDIVGLVARYTDGGAVDTTFGTGGFISPNFGGTNTLIYSIRLQQDGKIIVVGTFDSGGNQLVGIARYSADGILDSTYGTNGITTTDLGTTTAATSAVLQSDGKLVIAGYVDNIGTILRYDSTGVLDNSFNNDGILQEQINNETTIWNSVALKSDGSIAVGGEIGNFGSSAFAYANYTSTGSTMNSGRTVTKVGTMDASWDAIAVQPDGKSVVTGSAYIGGIFKIVVGRFTTAGLLDPTFGDNGIVTTTVLGDDFGKAIALQPDGKILIGAQVAVFGNDRDFAVLRYTSNGSLDATFGNSGVAEVDCGADDYLNTIKRDSDGKIILGGSTLASGVHKYAVARIDSGGSIDANFGVSGVVTTQIPLADGCIVKSFVLQNDGKIIAAGYSTISSEGHFTMIRYDSTGTVDSSFGASGNGIADSFFDYNSVGVFAATQSSGTIIAGGYSGDGTQNVFTVARYSADGVIDSSFGTNGVVKTAVGNYDDAASVGVQSDDKIIVAGRTWDGSQYIAAVVRYDAQGALDPNFGTGGKTTLDIDNDDEVTSLVILQDDKILVAGNIDNGSGWSVASVIKLNAASTPLPVELVSLNALVRENDVELLWKTATEVNNYGFEIERMTPSQTLPIQGGGQGGGWSKIGFVEGNGTTNSPQSYSFVDAGALGKTAYRLKQIDRDGKFSYSQSIEVTIGNAPNEFALSQNYPNPFNPTTSIQYSVPRSQKVSLKIYDAIGREVATLVNEVKETGRHTVTFNALNLSSGIYFYRLHAGNFITTKKLTLVK